MANDDLSKMTLVELITCYVDTIVQDGIKQRADIVDEFERRDIENIALHGYIKRLQSDMEDDGMRYLTFEQWQADNTPDEPDDQD